LKIFQFAKTEYQTQMDAIYILNKKDETKVKGNMSKWFSNTPFVETKQYKQEKMLKAKKHRSHQAKTMKV
jgi:hypothetical protein